MCRKENRMKKKPNNVLTLTHVGKRNEEREVYIVDIKSYHFIKILIDYISHRTRQKIFQRIHHFIIFVIISQHTELLTNQISILRYLI